VIGEDSKLSFPKIATWLLEGAPVMSALKKLNDSPKLPTMSRSLMGDEWKLCTDVFLSSNLPDRDDITITNGAGKDGRPFTVPTSTQDGIKGALLGMLYPALLIPSLEWGVVGSKVRGFTIN